VIKKTSLPADVVIEALKNENIKKLKIQQNSPSSSTLVGRHRMLARKATGGGAGARRAAGRHARKPLRGATGGCGARGRRAAKPTPRARAAAPCLAARARPCVRLAAPLPAAPARAGARR
jgi:hypothetical protein